ncbi:hypothetical protein [Xenorhabdus anantnagensis]|uniref:Periplasmic protein YqjC n=1 Tax=Xenorhabdus anantnagensis TaxID=3025875 RepID=A0ABT5LUH1_9GAMM|nr:hypothetical protein [Xenorhabdus anantnagensis]MDC9598062.1 hypothetical protein [Xenorhabdus anantnagensis]
MMSKTVILSVLIVFSMGAAYANQGKAGCEIKKTTLEKQLEYAQADKNERLIKKPISQIHQKQHNKNKKRRSADQ